MQLLKSGKAIDARRKDASCKKNRLSCLAPVAQAVQSPVATTWQKLQEPLIWQGTEKEAVVKMKTEFHCTPFWRMLLLSNGSVTKHLEMLTGADVSTELLEMGTIEENHGHLPLHLLKQPLVRRQVLLYDKNNKNEPHVYGTSWWSEEEYDQFMTDKNKPIWLNLSERQTELFREIQQIYYGHNKTIETYFGVPGPFWGRHYMFWHNGRPITLIYEVFSPLLCDYVE